jgi:hypothetical protein
VVEEIRIRDNSGIYRVIYTARLADTVFALHAFQKKTQRTSQRDIEIAKARFSEMMKGRGRLKRRSMQFGQKRLYSQVAESGRPMSLSTQSHRSELDRLRSTALPFALAADFFATSRRDSRGLLQRHLKGWHEDSEFLPGSLFAKPCEIGESILHRMPRARWAHICPLWQQRRARTSLVT